MKILCVTPYYKPAMGFGGSVTSLTIFLEEIAKLGVDVTVFTTNVDINGTLNVPLNRKITDCGVKIFYYPVEGVKNSFFYSPMLAKAILDNIKNFDLVISNSLWSHCVLPLYSACTREKVPYIVLLKGQLMPWAFKHKIWKKLPFLLAFGIKYLKNAAAVQGTDYIEYYYIDKWRLKIQKLVIPHGIDINEYCSLERSHIFREKFGVLKNEWLILFLGRLHKVKNPEMGVEVLKLLKRDDVHLVYCGPDEGRYEPRLIERARQYGIANKIHFPGFLDKSDIINLLADSDFLFLPSSQENFGMSAAEALAAGVPIITSPFVPVGSLAAKNECGRISRNDPYSYAKVFAELMDDKSLVTKMGEKAKIVASLYYDISVNTKMVIDHYQNIVARGTQNS
jgi:glycosyltransferase involved in cell wall biosynthesis